MNQVESAVSNVALSGSTAKRVRAQKAPAEQGTGNGVDAIKVPASAVLNGHGGGITLAEATKRGRGRQPVFLKGGKSLKDARDEAKATLAGAKQVLKDAKAAKVVTAKNDKDAARAVVSARTERGRVEAKPLPNKAEQKIAVTNAKAAVKSAETASKATASALNAADKAIAKAVAAVGKAEEARLKIESQHVAAKHPAAPAQTVN